MSKFFNYHIVYVATNEKTGFHVTGGSQLQRKSKIKTHDDITDVKNFLEKENGLVHLVITNIIKLKTTRER